MTCAINKIKLNVRNQTGTTECLRFSNKTASHKFTIKPSTIETTNPRMII